MENLIWIDTETTGLKQNRPLAQIIEIGVLITDSELNELDSYTVVIHASDEVLANMEPWSVTQHAKSGLTEACRNSKISQSEAEAAALALISKYVAPQESALWGNSIGLDRKFMEVHMPSLFSYLHYRNMDVSSFKVTAQLYYTHLPHFVKTETHRTLDDIRESVAEYSYYREHILQPPLIESPGTVIV